MRGGLGGGTGEGLSATPAASTVVSISSAGQQALQEATQPGANFSVSQGAGGQNFVGGLDANGFSMSVSLSAPETSQFSKFEDLLMALLLLKILEKMNKG